MLMLGQRGESAQGQPSGPEDEPGF